MDRTTEQMLALLRTSLSGATPELLPASEAEWEKLYWLARKHGVVTMVDDAIEGLPPQQQPQGDIALSWTLSAERTRYHYHHQAEVLATIRQKALAEGIGVGLIKGMSLARYYPSPSSRPCGDIDIFFLPLTRENYARGNALLGCPDAELDGKHAEVTIDGVEVENHLFFLDRHYVSQRRAERFIRASLKAVDENGYLNTEGNMVYLLMHTICHLTAKYKLPLRNILDWGMFLKANRERLEPAECHRVMRRIGMDDAFNMLTLLAGEFVGEDLSRYVADTLRQEDVGRMRELILDKKYLDPVPGGLKPLERVRVRMQRNRERRWLYRYLPSNGWERLVNRIIRVFYKG